MTQPETWKPKLPECVINSCQRPVRTAQMCPGHYKRWQRGVDLDSPLRDDFDWHERFWNKVNKTNTCWLWTGPLEKDGYAYFYLVGKNHSVHRISYELLRGPIPDGLTLDHLCRVRHCIRPKHLEAVTDQVNILRGHGLAAINAR